MADITIYTRATRGAVRRAIAGIPAAARGAGPVAEAALMRVGLAVLGRVRTAFVVKAHGGTDDAGERWAPLSPKTVAYSRSRPGPRSRPSGALTSAQSARWWALYKQGLAIFKGDKGSAAKRAWATLKREGATTILAKYGNRQVEILRDTGALLNSISPEVASADRVLDVRAGEVVVGTNVPYAKYHHHGVPGRLPQRRLWPEPAKWPPSWWRDILAQARAGVVEIAIHLIKDAK